MTVVRPVLAESPLKQQQFINPKTGALTDYGHHVLTALFERTGGFDDDTWTALGLGFTAIAQQGRTDLRLQGLEGAVAGLASDVGGLRGDPRLQTADRADAAAKDALAVAFSRAGPDVVRRVEELERNVALLSAALAESRAQTQMALRQQTDEIRDATVRAAFESALSAYGAYQDRVEAKAIEDQIDAIEADFDTRARLAISGLAPVVDYDSDTGVISLNDSLISFGLLTVSGADSFAYSTGADTWALGTITTFGRSLVDDANAAEAQTTLGLGSLATASTINNDNWSGTDLAVANGGTGASTASGARTNLGLVTQTGWSAASGTATRSTFDTATVTLPQLAERVKALVDDLLAFNALGA